MWSSLCIICHRDVIDGNIRAHDDKSIISYISTYYVLKIQKKYNFPVGSTNISVNIIEFNNNSYRSLEF